MCSCQWNGTIGWFTMSWRLTLSFWPPDEDTFSPLSALVCWKQDLFLSSLLSEIQTDFICLLFGAVKTNLTAGKDDGQRLVKTIKPTQRATRSYSILLLIIGALRTTHLVPLLCCWCERASLQLLFLPLLVQFFLLSSSIVCVLAVSFNLIKCVFVRACVLVNLCVCVCVQINSDI